MIRRVGRWCWVRCVSSAGPAILSVEDVAAVGAPEERQGEVEFSKNGPVFGAVMIRPIVMRAAYLLFAIKQDADDLEAELIRDEQKRIVP